MASKSHIIGLYLPMQYEFGPRIATGVLQYVEQHPPLRVHDFCSYKDIFMQEGFEPPSPRPPWTGIADGAVLYIRRLPNFIEWVCSGGVPVINTNAETIDTSIVTVYTSLADIPMAVDHLSGLGHRNFAFVGLAGSYGSELRRDALREELADRNLRLHKVIEIADATRDGQGRARRFGHAERGLEPDFRQPNKTLAIVAGDIEFDELRRHWTRKCVIIRSPEISKRVEGVRQPPPRT